MTISSPKQENKSPRAFSIFMRLLPRSTNFNAPTTTITFTNEKLVDPRHNLDDLVVVSTMMRNCMVMRIVVDQGSFANILYWHVFCKISPSGDFKNCKGTLVGFLRDLIIAKGVVTLRVTLRTPPLTTYTDIDFIVVAVSQHKTSF